MRGKSEKEFIKHVRRVCKEYNVKFLLKNTKKIKISDNIFCGGYFEDFSKKKGVLACAAKNKDYLLLLVHEFSHMEQWIEQTQVWKNAKHSGSIDEWLDGKSICNINSKIDKVKMLELDCERRALENIKKFNLPIDLKIYAQKANSYILFYNYIKETRKWSKPGKAPYSEVNRNLFEKCPSKIMNDKYYEKIPTRVYRLFVKHNI